VSVDLRFVTLTGRCTRGAGSSPATGFVRLGAIRPVDAPYSDVTMSAQASEPIPLDADGRFVTRVAANDSLLAAPLYLEVQFLLTGAFPFVKLYNVVPAGDTIDLADCMEIGDPMDNNPVVTWGQVGRPGGVASLDSAGKVPLAQIPGGGGGGGTGSVESVNGKTPNLAGDVTLTASDVGALTQTTGDARYQQSSGMGAYATDAELASGLAGKANTTHTHTQSDVTGLVTALSGKAAVSHTHAESEITGLVTDLAGKAAVSHGHVQSDVTGLVSALAAKADLVAGKVPQSQIPAVALVDFLGSVASQAAMLALTGQRGDWANRSDTGTTWQLVADDPTQLSSWQEHLYPGSPVSSVAGRTGAVVLSKSDVGLGSVDNTSDAGKPVSTAGQAALDLKAPLASPTFTGTVSGVTKTHVGLGNVDNTSDSGKPVSTAQQAALDAKAPLASPAFTGTPTGISKTHVGLGNVDNTADSAKPVSTAQQTALDGKVALATVDAKGDLLVGTADNTVARLAVGSNGKVLAADSAQSTGLAWVTPAAGSSGEQEAYGPGGAGFDEWTCDPVHCAAHYVTNNGVLFLVRHRFRKAFTLDEVGFVLWQAGVSPGAYSGVAVYEDGQGTVNRLAQSADQGSAFTSVGAKSLPLTAGVSVAAGDFRWIGYLWQGSSAPHLTAPPGPEREAMMNVGARRTVFTTGQSGFPSSLDVSALTLNTTTYWFSFV
jgi:hypothetical protein